MLNNMTRKKNGKIHPSKYNYILSLLARFWVESNEIFDLIHEKRKKQRHKINITYKSPHYHVIANVLTMLRK